MVSKWRGDFEGGKGRKGSKRRKIFSCVGVES